MRRLSVENKKHQQVNVKRAQIKEDFIARYLAETGAKIDDTVLVEQMDINTSTIRYWCEPKAHSSREMDG